MKQTRFLKGLYLPYFWGPLLVLMIFLLLVFFTNLKSFTYEKANENLKSLSHLLHKEYKDPFLAKDLETLQKKIDIDSQKLQVKISFFKENKLLLEDQSVYLKKEDPALKFVIPFKKNEIIQPTRRDCAGSAREKKDPFWSILRGGAAAKSS